MTGSGTAHAGLIPFPLMAVLAILLSNAGLASAQVYRIETLFGDFDPLEAVPLDEAWVLHPTALATDSEGSLYFVDRDAFRVRKVDRSGRVSTIAGSGLLGYSGDGGPATSARLGDRVEGLAVDGEGNVYIADTENLRIRRVDASGTITTFAGTGRWGTEGDGGPATRAGLTAMHGLAADAQGNLYVADTWNDRIRKIDTEGIITTVAGAGEEGVSGDGGSATEARLNKPRGVAVDAVGNLYIADSDNRRIRKVDSKGTITTIAGTGDRGYSGDGGPATEAALDQPYAVTVDAVGNIYVADSRNRIVRKVALDGTISTAAGIPPGAGAGPNGVGGNQSMGFPRALATGLGGELYIADSYRDSILRLATQRERSRSLSAVASRICTGRVAPRSTRPETSTLPTRRTIGFSRSIPTVFPPRLRTAANAAIRAMEGSPGPRRSLPRAMSRWAATVRSTLPTPTTIESGRLIRAAPSPRWQAQATGDSEATAARPPTRT